MFNFLPQFTWKQTTERVWMDTSRTIMMILQGDGTHNQPDPIRRMPCWGTTLATMFARESGERERRTRATLVPRRFTPPDRFFECIFRDSNFSWRFLVLLREVFHLDKLVAVDRSGPFSPQRWSRCRCRIWRWLLVTYEHQYKRAEDVQFLNQIVKCVVQASTFPHSN